jgi:hypothetical protein
MPMKRRSFALESSRSRKPSDSVSNRTRSTNLAYRICGGKWHKYKAVNGILRSNGQTDLVTTAFREEGVDEGAAVGGVTGKTNLPMIVPRLLDANPRRFLAFIFVDIRETITAVSHGIFNTRHPHVHRNRLYEQNLIA